MADELPPNLDPKEVPGGEAINKSQGLDSYGIRKKLEPKKNFGQRLQEGKGKLGDKGKQEVADQAKKAVTKVIRQATTQAIRTAIAWVAAALGPYTVPVVIVVIAIVIIVVAITAAYGNRANKGLHGLSQAQAANKYDSSVIGDIRVVLGDQIMVTNDPQANYFSQGDPAFNTEPLKGSWIRLGPGKKLKDAGCGLTACTMMMRYYGVTDITPVDFANRMVEKTGHLDLDTSVMLSYVKGKKLVQVNHNASAVASYIQNGDPVLAHGNPICGSSGQHYVLIIGISKDLQNFVISDPAADDSKDRQSAARYCSNDKLLGGIIDLIAFQNAK